MLSAWEKFCRSIAAFATARRGNVAMTFALAAVPIIVSVGAAIDYSRGNSVKASLQAALDTTALMLSKDAEKNGVSNLSTPAQTLLNALFVHPGLSPKVTDATYTTDGGSAVIVDGTVSVPTTIMAVFGKDSMTVSASSTVRWGTNRLRVALVLDNTGSMADAGKMTALKAATTSLLTQLKNAAKDPDDVYVSIIPFAKDVNLDDGNYNADWIYWDDAAHTDNSSWDANNGSCSKSGYSPRSKCLQQPSCSIAGNNSQSTCTNAGSCSISGYSNRSSCTGASACSKSQWTTRGDCLDHNGNWTKGTWTTGVWAPPIWTPSNHRNWNGCVVDRGNPGGPSADNYDTNAAIPDINTPATLYPAEQYNACTQTVMPLTNDWASMNSLVSGMTPNGNTNQGIGLQLGWVSLVGGGPFTVPVMESGYKYNQVIILLTDGLNTQNRWYTNQNSIDTREQMTCNNIKAADITLYTIQVNTGNDPTSTLLQNCASTSDKFFLSTSASQIGAAFQKIASDLTQLRVAQ